MMVPPRDWTREQADNWLLGLDLKALNSVFDLSTQVQTSEGETPLTFVVEADV
jgi:hypothetical protein